MEMKLAERIWQDMEASKLVDLRRTVVRMALEYAQIRAGWYVLSAEERVLRDRARTLAHNALIDACNILSRNMAKAGEDISWRAELGDDRKVIGDFACCLHALLGLRMR